MNHENRIKARQALLSIEDSKKRTHETNRIEASYNLTSAVQNAYLSLHDVTPSEEVLQRILNRLEPVLYETCTTATN